MSDEIKEAYKSIRGEKSEHEITERERDIARDDLYDASTLAKGAMDDIARKLYQEAHKKIQSAHTKLRSADSLLGFKPEIRKWEL